MKGDEPAFPLATNISSNNERPAWVVQVGLTKRELACIELRIPDTGDAELDALIAKAQRRDQAGMAMQGFLPVAVKSEDRWLSNVAYVSVLAADTLLAELEKERG